MKHELKTDHDVFEAVDKELKNFEIRLNDRDYNVGDTLLLRETVYDGKHMKHGSPLEYTGRKITVLVNYILFGPIYGLAENWVIMAIERIEDEEEPEEPKKKK